MFSSQLVTAKRILNSCALTFTNTSGPIEKINFLLSLALVRKLGHLFLKARVKNVKVAVEVF